MALQDVEREGQLGGIRRRFGRRDEQEAGKEGHRYCVEGDGDARGVGGEPRQLPEADLAGDPLQG